MDQKISLFWDKYIEKSIACGVHENSLRWYVRHIEEYIKAHSTCLQMHCGKAVDEYCQEKDRKQYLS